MINAYNPLRKSQQQADANKPVPWEVPLGQTQAFYRSRTDLQITSIITGQTPR